MRTSPHVAERRYQRLDSAGVADLSERLGGPLPYTYAKAELELAEHVLDGWRGDGREFDEGLCRLSAPDPSLL